MPVRGIREVAVAALAAALLVSPRPVRADSSPQYAALNASADGSLRRLIDLRRDLHAHPELAGYEERTAKIVAGHLAKLGLEVKSGVGGFGVVGVLKGGKPGPVVAYRADMDAVPMPVTEKTPYASQNPGAQHACGHDMHVAIGLGIAEALVSIKADLPGTVVFLFQPAEEAMRGAAAMIAAGALKDPAPKAVFALHCMPYHVGEMGVAPGHGVAGTDIFTLRVKDSDAARAAFQKFAQRVNALTTIRQPLNVDAYIKFWHDQEDPATAIKESVAVAARITNEGDDRVFMGLVRAYPSDKYEPVRAAVKAAAEEAFGANLPYILKFSLPDVESPLLDAGGIFPAMRNDARLSEETMGSVREAIAPAKFRVSYSTGPFNSEDFALYQKALPGVMYWLGVENQPAGFNGMPHHPQFDADEHAIAVGVKAMGRLLFDYQIRHAADAAQH